MCFSAGASFTSGVLLTFVGVETLKKVHKPSQIVLASIPVFFAFHQFTEGVLWLVIKNPGFAGLQTVFTYIFTVMAQAVWPVMIPLSVFLMEENKIRKRILAVLLAIGSIVALYYLYRMVFFHIAATIVGNHISYQSNSQNPFGVVDQVLYLAATLIPLFVSSIKRAYILGIIMTLSFVISAVFYMQCLTSVWCFFAAVISFVVFYIIRDSHEKFHSGKAGKA